MQSDSSIAEILQDVIGDVQEILRSELRLAKAETRDEVSKAAKSRGLLLPESLWASTRSDFCF
jgi:hypothetical protein